MHHLYPPSFLRTSTTGDAHTEVEGLTTPLSNIAWRCCPSSSWNASGVRRVGSLTCRASLVSMRCETVIKWPRSLSLVAKTDWYSRCRLMNFSCWVSLKSFLDGVNSSRRLSGRSRAFTGWRRRICCWGELLLGCTCYFRNRLCGLEVSLNEDSRASTLW